ncbi:unnamed protein product, partial [Ectocarpus sp. 4 AP-2014]
LCQHPPSSLPSRAVAAAERFRLRFNNLIVLNHTQYTTGSDPSASPSIVPDRAHPIPQPTRKFAFVVTSCASLCPPHNQQEKWSRLSNPSVRLSVCLTWSCP